MDALREISVLFIRLCDTREDDHAVGRSSSSTSRVKQETASAI